MTPWTVAPRPTPLSMEFSRQEYWSGLPFPTLGDLPSPGIEPMSPLSPPLQADYLPSESHKGINICKALNMVLVYSRCPIKASCYSASYHFIIEYVFFHFLSRPLGFKGLRSHRGRLSQRRFFPPVSESRRRVLWELPSRGWRPPGKLGFSVLAGVRGQIGVMGFSLGSGSGLIWGPDLSRTLQWNQSGL